MAENVMLQEAIDAIRQGQRRRARDLLTRLLRADQSNPEYWLWMSAVVDSLKERKYCLEMVLRMDPDNRQARHGLVMMGAVPPPSGLTPAAVSRRKWKVAEEDIPRPHGLKAIWANPVLRGAMIIGLSIVLIGLVVGVIFWSGRTSRVRAWVPTVTPGPPPTFTLTPTLIPSGREPTPTLIPLDAGPTPLAIVLNLNYTVTPVYIATPHPISEAYRAGQRAFERGDIESALRFMQQASQVEPEAADIIYHIGEVQRLQGEYQAAIDTYTQAIDVNPRFAPAFLGRALASLALEQLDGVEQDLTTSIERDDQYGEAYLQRAAFWLSQGDLEAAQDDLDSAEELMPESTWLPLYRAEIALAQGDPESALALARLANKKDLTLLPGYLVLGKALLENGSYNQAFQALETYTLYVPDDAQGWLALGQAYTGSGALEEAQESLDKAIELDESLAEAYVARGLVFIELDEGQSAVNDLLQANRIERRSFAINLNLGRALFASGRLNEARSQFNTSLDLAEEDQQMGQVYYWRAQLLEALGNRPVALQDWERLIDLPDEAVPEEWVKTAQRHLTDAGTAPARTPSVGTDQ
jgi:tetratricopeptide (TPR) repeat protein